MQRQDLDKLGKADLMKKVMSGGMEFIRSALLDIQHGIKMQDHW